MASTPDGPERERELTPRPRARPWGGRRRAAELSDLPLLDEIHVEPWRARPHRRERSVGRVVRARDMTEQHAPQARALEARREIGDLSV